MSVDAREWLETDGLGGFTLGTVSGIRTRRYHGLLLTATTPPTGRVMLVSGFDAWVDNGSDIVNLTTQRYRPDVLHPDGASNLQEFKADPWPTWRWRLTGDVDLVQEIFVPRGRARVVVRWRLAGTPPIRAGLHVRPFLSGRDYHSLQHENPALDFTPRHVREDVVEWHPYQGVPGIRSYANGVYRHAPDWYRNFLYVEERTRGLDDTEDLASPGTLEWDLTGGDAVWILEPASEPLSPELVVAAAAADVDAETERRARYASRLHRSADQYIVARGTGSTIVAGYPWFTDWGRDTFIALRGVCLAAGRVATARDILLEWAGAVSEGMLPNRFPDAGDAPEFNSVDASLWFIIAVHDLLAAAGSSRQVTVAQRRRLMSAANEILCGYTRGTRFGIRADSDGLLAAGVPGSQLTWMDARVGDDTVTPRVGKPVEIQALWLNALAFAGRKSAEWRRQHERASAVFEAKFWNEARGCLYDVVDVDHVPGRVDGALRPNQIFAIGGLPLPCLTGERAARVVDTVERELLTPLGLRSLAPGEPGYTAHYEGNSWSRDHAYHQGTVWPWLLGAFVDAWVRVRAGAPAARAEAYARFVQPLLGQLDRLGLGHLPEIADAEPPHTPRGCPFQAWSVGELLRVAASNLGD